MLGLETQQNYTQLTHKPGAVLHTSGNPVMRKAWRVPLLLFLHGNAKRALLFLPTFEWKDLFCPLFCPMGHGQSLTHRYSVSNE